jgi:Mu transposase-like protein
MLLADQRCHRTTREAPVVRFDRDERHQLRALPIRALPRRAQRLRRRVALDAFIDVDTVRYSVPHHLVRDHVEVVVHDDRVEIFHGTQVVATHARSSEPFARVVDPAHYAGLWRASAPIPTASLTALGRDLADYAAIVAGGGQ